MALIEKLDSKIPCLGILFILCSSVFATGGKYLVKKLPDLNSVVIVMVRCGLLSFIWLIIVAIRRDFILGKSKKELRLLILRGFLGWLTFILSYYALSFIPLADATTIILSSPIYTSIFGYFMLRERCGPINIGLIVLTLSGVIMIAKPPMLIQLFGGQINEEDETTKIIGTTLAFLSSIIAALANIIIRKLKETPAPVVVTWFAFSSFMCSIFVIVVAKIVLPFEHTETIRVIDFEYEFFILLFNSACGVFAQLFITLALKVEEAGTISLARSVDILLSFIFQALFLNEPIEYTSIIGALIIALGVTLSALNKIREKRQSNNNESKINLDLESTSSANTEKTNLEIKHSENKEKSNNSIDKIFSNDQYLTVDSIKKIQNN